MRKVSKNAAAASVATTTQQVDPENNINTNTNATSLSTTTVAAVGGPTNNGMDNINTIPPTTTTRATTDPMMKAIMKQNHELSQQNVVITSAIKEQHDFIKFELQQMKQLMQRFVDSQPLVGNTTVVDATTIPATLQRQQHQPAAVLADNNNNNEANDNNNEANDDNDDNEVDTDNDNNEADNDNDDNEVDNDDDDESHHSNNNTVGGSSALQIQPQPVLANNNNNEADDVDKDDDESHHSNNNTIIIDDTTIPYESTLSDKPKDLYQLWREYQYGLEGRKAAKRFTTKEIFKVRDKYHRRNIVWAKIIRMKRCGRYKTSHIAIKELYDRYGGKDKTITYIIKQIRLDRRKKKPPSAAAAAQQQQQQTLVDGVPKIIRANDNDNNSSYHSDDTTIIDDDDGTIPYETTLSKHPKDLYHLWEEYQYGIDGRKPAKKFTSKERGRVKYKYHRRKIVWDKIKELLLLKHNNEDYTFQTAIEEIYRIYSNNNGDGNKKKVTVSEIINLLKEDRPKTIKKIKSTARI